MTLATIKIYSPALALVDTIVLDWIQFIGGSPEKTQANVPQPLESMGVDNSRLRWNRKDYKPFRANGCLYIDTYNNAVLRCDALRAFEGYVATIEYVADGVTYAASMLYYMTDAAFIPKREDSVGGVVGARGTMYMTATFKATGTTI